MKEEIKELEPLLPRVALRITKEWDFPEGRGYFVEPIVEYGVRAKTDPECVQVYILQRLIEGLGVIAGVVFEKREQHVFVPRAVNQPTESLPTNIQTLVKYRENLQMDDGQVFFTTSSARMRVRAIGDIGYQTNEEFEPATFSVPTRGKNARRVVTAINRDDSFGKEEWRKNIRDFVKHTLLCERISGFRNDHRLLCFPGLGKEAIMWRDLIISPDQMFFIERNPQIAEKLAKRFPESHVMPHEFGANREMTRKKIIDPLAKKLKDEKKKSQDFDSWIINFDPESGLTRNFYQSMVDLFRSMPLGHKCCIGVNFTGKREQMPQIRFYRELHPAALNHNLTLAQLRGAAVTKAVPAALSEAGKEYNILNHISGSYEGESDGSRMYYAMHLLCRKS